MCADPWLIATYLYAAFALVTLIVAIRPAFRRLPDVEACQFANCPHFTKDEQTLLIAHYKRMQGTLKFWKKQASICRRFHTYVVLWTVPSSVLIPVLTQFITPENWASVMVTVVSTFTAALVALHQALKFDEKHRDVRYSESAVYDLYRRMLDRPESFGKDRSIQLNAYFEQVERIRSAARKTETDLAAVGDSKPSA